MKDLLPIQVLAEKGKSLTKIIRQHYPEANRVVLDAIVLANPEIDSENVIHPGQVINLPKIDCQGKTIQLQDGLLYALYGSYYSVASWNGDKPWLEKNKVRFLVRVTREATGRKIHRIFLGGYEKLADLQEAQESLGFKSRRPSLSRREDVSRNITSPRGKNEDASDNLPYWAEKPAPVTAGTRSGPPMEPAPLQLDLLRDSRDKVLTLAATWLKSLTFTQPAAKLALGQTPHEVESIYAEPSADQEAAISKTFLAKDCSEGGAEVAGNSSQEPASETGVVETQPALVREASRPAEIHHPVAYAFQVLKIKPAVVGSLKRHWESQRSCLAGWRHHFMSLAPMVPAYTWLTLNEAALEESNTGEGEKIPVSPLAQEGSPSREEPPLATTEPVAQANTSPINIRRYLDAGGAFRIENQGPRHTNAKSSEPYVEPTPVALGAYLESLNGVQPPTNYKTDDIQPRSEGSGPGGEQAPLPAPPREALLPEGNVRRYLDAKGVWHIVNGDPKNTIHPSGTTLPDAGSEVKGFAEKQNESQPPADSRAGRGIPLKKVSWPPDEPGPLAPPESRTPEKALLPEGNVRRYQDAKGVWHIVNGEPKNTIHSSGTTLADAGSEVKGFSDKQNESQPPADSRAGHGVPLKKVSWPADEPGPLAPPESRTPERALFPEGTVRRYRDGKGIWHIVNSEPKNPDHRRKTILATAGPGVSGTSKKLIEIRTVDGAKVNPGGSLRKVSWPGDEPGPLVPSESRPPEKALLAEGAIRRYRDTKGVLHIESVEYPKPAPWPPSLRLARNMASIRTAEAGSLPQQLSTQQVVAFKDQKGRLHISNPDLENMVRKGAQELNRASLEPIIIEAAFSYGLPVPLVQALIKVESNFVPWAVSPKGAMGLMQLMPRTATFLEVQDPFSPRENIMGGCRYLRLLLDCFNENLSLALAAYNAGYQRVIDAGYRVPEISETQNFVTEVISQYYKLVLARRPAGA